MTVLRTTLNDIYSPIEAELNEFSVALKKELASDDRLIGDIHTHLLKMTGKFLRPALTLLCGKSGNRTNPDVIPLAVAIELIHTATLVHDDIIDNSNLRRNQPSVHSKWGREISIVAGDYLYAKAFLLLARLKDAWVTQAFAECAHVMCEGEMKQIEKRNDFLLSEAEYLKIIHKKTAALFQAACMGGAYYSGTDTASIHAFGDYGFQIGMAFQIVDDCLDLTGETETLGKTIGLDINKNDMTLPLLYLLHDLNDSERKNLIGEFREGNNTLFPRIQKLACERQSVEKAMQRARQYSARASEALTTVKSSTYKDSLLQLAAHCVERAR